MKIISKRNNIKLEIEQLYEKVDSFANERAILLEELTRANILFKRNNEELDNTINKIYNRKKIKESIAEFVKQLNELYLNKFNCELVADISIFNKELFHQILGNSIESIFKSMKFVRMLSPLKITTLFVLLVFLLPGLAFYLAYVYGRGFDSYGGDWEYNNLGYILNGTGIGYCLFLKQILSVIPTTSDVYSDEVLSLIKNEKEQQFRTLLNYLNSIHSLPKEILKRIK